MKQFKHSPFNGDLVCCCTILEGRLETIDFLAGGDPPFVSVVVITLLITCCCCCCCCCPPQFIFNAFAAFVVIAPDDTRFSKIQKKNISINNTPKCRLNLFLFHYIFYRKCGENQL